MKEQIEVITYEQDRLNYFTDLMKKAQERYKRLFKKHKDAPYLSEEAQTLSDAGRETHFLGDVVGMLEKGYRKQSEWISVTERMPEQEGTYLVCSCEYNQMMTRCSFTVMAFGGLEILTIIPSPIGCRFPSRRR